MTTQRNFLSLERVSFGAGSFPLSASLQPGLHVFCGPSHLSAALCRVLAGLDAPRRGALRFEGPLRATAPHASPELRRRTASLLAHEPPLLGATVAAHFSALHIAVAPPLEAWAARGAASLDAEERRVVAAHVALQHAEPWLVALHEPETLEPAVSSVELAARLDAWQDGGAIVVVTTPDPRRARMLGGRLWSLTGAPLAETTQTALLVRSSAARQLAARLAGHPAVEALSFDERAPRDLLLRGASVDPLCVAVRDAVLAERCELSELCVLQRPEGAPLR